VATYLVEFYVPQTRQADAVELIARTRGACDALGAEGTLLRLLHAVVEPVSELCLCFFEAETDDAVLEGVRRAELPFAGVPEAVEFVR
jgi:hypothetical protein